MEARGRLAAWARGALCAALLALLAVCGYMGASGREETATVSVPVERTILGSGALSAETAEDARRRLASERAQEVEMLDSVIDSPRADATTVKSALTQKTELTRRMEAEAQAEAVLCAMGIADAMAVCGAQMLTLILPAESAANEAERAQVIGAASEQTGIAAESVKIILVKNE